MSEYSRQKRLRTQITTALISMNKVELLRVFRHSFSREDYDAITESEFSFWVNVHELRSDWPDVPEEMRQESQRWLDEPIANVDKTIEMMRRSVE